MSRWETWWRYGHEFEVLVNSGRYYLSSPWHGKWRGRSRHVGAGIGGAVFWTQNPLLTASARVDKAARKMLKEAGETIDKSAPKIGGPGGITKEEHMQQVSGCTCSICYQPQVPQASGWTTQLAATQAAILNALATPQALPAPSPASAFVQQAYLKYANPAPALDCQAATAKLDAQEPETEVLRGWRMYYVDAKYRLVGSFDTPWESATMEAQCKAVVYESLKSPDVPARDHLAAGACLCGIYSHKQSPEYLEERMGMRPECGTKPSEPTLMHVAAQVVNYGIVIEAEYGYRAEFARIEQLWLLVPRPCRMGHQQAVAAAANSSTVMCPLCLLDRPLGVGDCPTCSYPLDRVAGVSDYPTWECDTQATGTRHGEGVAAALSQHYGVPCQVLDYQDFVTKLDKGGL